MIETDRLKIFPLTYEQVVKYRDCKNDLEKELVLNESKCELPNYLKMMIGKKILPNLSGKKENFIYSTIWLVIDKIENIIVADFGIKGDPKEDGEIELGYGTHSIFQNKGYMTEAINGFLKWASEKDEVKLIFVETDKVNVASIKVVEKNNFEKFKETDNSLWWKYSCDLQY